MHATHIIDNLWVGSWKDAESILTGPDAEHWGVITTANDAHVKGNIWFPITDPGTDWDDPKRIEGAIRTALDFMGTYDNVLVHCQSGINRSVSVVIGVLMSKYDMNLSDAYSYVFARRKLIHPQRALLYMACLAAGKRFPKDFERDVLKLDDIEQAVNELYIRVLRRDADPGGLDNYAGAVKSGRMTIHDVERSLYCSSEYEKKFGVKKGK